MAHLFLHCPFMAKAWHFIISRVGLPLCLLLRVETWLLDGLNARSLRGKAKILWNCTIGALFCRIWKERKVRTFKDKFSALIFYASLHRIQLRGGLLYVQFTCKILL